MRALVSATATVLAFGLAPRPVPAPAAPTVVLLVRHAEKAAEPAQDPPLTPEGMARARALATIAQDAGVTAIITTQFERTRRTADPTAAAQHVTPEVVPAGPMPQHARAVAEQVMRHAGGTVLVVGHSNTIPAIVGALGAPQPRELCDSEYDRLFVVVLGDAGTPRLIRSRYGAPSGAESGCPAMR